MQGVSIGHSLKPSKVLSTRLLNQLFEKLADFSESHSFRNFSINWHGGEPMIADLPSTETSSICRRGILATFRLSIRCKQTCVHIGAKFGKSCANY